METSKHYILEITAREDGSNIEITSSNDGFTAFELIGFLDYKKNDLVCQLKDMIDTKRTARGYSGKVYDINEK